MTSPTDDRADTQLMTLADGRRLAYARYGLAGGRPLFYLHGLPGSRYECQLIDTPARNAGIAVIAPDRPGYGLTEPRQDRSLCAWTDDVASLADQLGIDRFSVVGVSGGGPCALACAHQMPERVTALGLVASLGPVYETSLRNAMGCSARLAFYLANTTPAAFNLLVGQPISQLARRQPELLLRLMAEFVGGPDKQTLLEPPILRAFSVSTRACFQQGTVGSMQDLYLFRQPWGFELDEIRQPVHLWHGQRDTVVPLGHSRHLHSHLPHASLDIVPQEGHFSLPLKQMGTILDALLSEQAG